MKIKFHFLFFCFCTVLFFDYTANAQIMVHVNSGNPKFPFPQFLPYTDGSSHNLGNLATQNAPGVTHAEMEQTIREAWQIMANRFVYTGEVYKGVKYIQSSRGVGVGYIDCSEGVGYAMMGAAIMGDKITFDGIWFKEHDEKKALNKKYNDCSKIIRSDYKYGKNTLTDQNQDVATDGTMDMVMGLLLAWKQWGDLSGYDDACGNPISYKQEALDAIRSLVELHKSLDGVTANVFVSGIIGFDGYFKGCNTTGEMTDWAKSLNPGPQMAGPSGMEHIDYVSAGYFRAFADFLKKQGGTAEDLSWNIEQLLRAQASTSWINGQLLKTPTSIPTAGWVSVIGNNATFSSYMAGEDWRHPWRASMDALWHRTPDITWDPLSHQYKTSSTNTYEKDISIRLAQFVKDARQSPWNHGCADARGALKLTFFGPSILSDKYDANTGDLTGSFPLNWLPGAVSPAAVVSQDYDLMGLLYRQCAITWDAANVGDGYITSEPKYFHGWARLLGMLVLSGNHQSPLAMIQEANMKVYSKVDKTIAYTNDLVTFTFDYRNYAAIDAKNVKIINQLAPGLEFVSASNGGIESGGIVTWNLNTVNGFKSGNIDDTKGKVTLVCRIAKSATGRITNRAQINTSNGSGWQSNDYPNNITATLERNSVDVEQRALEIEKTADKSKAKVGEVVTYTVNFENSSKGGFINGGRPGVVVAYANEGTAANAPMHTMKLQLYNNAIEPYIDYGNYRISMFIDSDLPDPWSLNVTNVEGADQTKFVCKVEDIIPGKSAQGNWNQRIIVQFAPQLATITQYLQYYRGNTGINIHKGANAPFRAFCQMNQGWSAGQKWDDDWSWNPAAAGDIDGKYYPITNDWTDIYNPDIPVTKWMRESCQDATQTVNNMLVEEYDGYTWRRVFGNAPVAGRDIYDAVVKDILPKGFKFIGFVDDKGKNLGTSTSILGETVSYDIASHTINWKKSRLLIKEKGTIRYKLEAGFITGGCSGTAELAHNIASIEAQNESAIQAQTSVVVYDDVKCPASSVCSLKVINKPAICEGEKMVLEANTLDIIEWRDDAGKLLTEKNATGNEITSLLPTVKPTKTTTYTVKAVNGNNLITNGDFELPITDYTSFSNYTYDSSPNGVTTGEFAIGTEARFHNSWFLPTKDHFVTGGKFMIIDGASDPTKVIYKAMNIPVKKGEEYAFSAWIANIHNTFDSPFELQFYIDGKPAGNKIIGYKNAEWFKFHTVWMATSDATIIIELRNSNTSPKGNDFGLDNLSFTSVCSENTTIKVHKNPTIDPIADVFVCKGASKTISPKVIAGDGLINLHFWTNPNLVLEDATIQNPTISPLAPANTYKLDYKVTDVNKCSATQSVNLKVETAVAGSNNTIYICPEGSYTLPSGTISETYSWSDPSNVVINSTPALAKSKGIYTYTATNRSSTAGCTSSGTITIEHFTSPEPIINGGNALAEVCPGGSVLLDAGHYQTYLWEDNSNLQTKVLSTLGKDSYVKVTDGNGCLGTSNKVKLFEKQNPKIVLSKQEVCEGYPLIVNNKVTGGSGIISKHIWTGDITILDKTDIQEPTVQTKIAPGSYLLTYQATDKNKCIATGNMEVIILPNTVLPNLNESICPEGSYLLPKPLLSGLVYEWKDSNGSSISTVPNATVNIPDKYTYALSSSFGSKSCSSIGELNLTHYTSPQPTINGGASNVELCPGKFIVLDPGIYTSYQWNDEIAFGKNRTKTVNNSGLRFVTVSDKNGCVGTSNVVNVIEKPKPIYVLNQNTALCPFKTMNLDAQSGFSSYNWELNGISISNNQNLAVSNEGVYVSNVNDGCYDLSSPVNITTPITPTYNLVQDATICPNNLHRLDALEGFVSYNWLFNNVTISSTRYADISQEGIYTIQVNDGCYSLSDHVTISHLRKPTYTLHQDQSICPQEELELNAVGNFIRYTWSKDGNKISDQQNIHINSSGIYQSRVYDGCYELSSPVIITEYSSPSIQQINNSIPGELSVSATNGTPPYEYALLSSDNTIPSFGTKNHFKDLTGGLYSVMVKDVNGCHTEMPTDVKNLELIIPNYFTPNGDGYNDRWMVENIQKYPTAKIIIYNRYGSILAQYTGKDLGWDGTNNGIEMPTSCYWYTIRIDDQNIIYKGEITLKR